MTQIPTTSIPYNGSGTINIHVNNPSASLGGMPNCFVPQCLYPAFYYPPQYYMQNIPAANQNQTTNVNVQGGNGASNKKPETADTSTKKNVEEHTTIKKETVEEPKKEREIVVLTDNYIKTLENYLRSNNVDLRKDAVKEILMRFKEDKSRLENQPLTALLNLALQDKNGVVRSIAMSAVQAGYAKGDNKTEQLLRKMQNTKTNFNTDATQATDSLLQMVKTKKLVKDNSHFKDNTSKSGKKGV